MLVAERFPIQYAIHQNLLMILVVVWSWAPTAEAMNSKPVIFYNVLYTERSMLNNPMEKTSIRTLRVANGN